MTCCCSRDVVTDDTSNSSELVVCAEKQDKNYRRTLGLVDGLQT